MTEGENVEDDRRGKDGKDGGEKESLRGAQNFFVCGILGRRGG